MTTLTLKVDEHTRQELARLSADEGVPADEMALRLLRRAVRQRRPRPAFDPEKVRAHAAEFADEDLSLANSDPAHRLSLLEAEDAE